jgi:hypothetical protein
MSLRGFPTGLLVVALLLVGVARADSPPLRQVGTYFADDGRTRATLTPRGVYPTSDAADDRAGLPRARVERRDGERWTTVWDGTPSSPPMAGS